MSHSQAASATAASLTVHELVRSRLAARGHPCRDASRVRAGWTQRRLSHLGASTCRLVAPRTDPNCPALTRAQRAKSSERARRPAPPATLRDGQAYSPRSASLGCWRRDRWSCCEHRQATTCSAPLLRRSGSPPSNQRCRACWLRAERTSGGRDPRSRMARPPAPTSPTSWSSLGWTAA
jgi:hypothetical protein